MSGTEIIGVTYYLLYVYLIFCVLNKSYIPDSILTFATIVANQFL